MKFHRLNTLVHSALLAGLLLLGGCGGSSSDSTALSPDGPQTGQVALLFTDAPSDEFDQVLVSFDEVTLMGEEGHQLIYPRSAGEQAITIDLLALREVADLAFIREVPAGTYSKVRLNVSSVELVKGAQRSFVDLVANGKLDLNPRGDFQVRAGQLLFIQLDIDANRSFQAHMTGNGRWKFRPVVFMDIFGDYDTRRLMRVFGEVAAVDAESDPVSFELCPTTMISQSGEPVNLSSEHSHCVRVFPGDSGIFSDEDGVDLGPGGLVVSEPPQQLTAVGYFRSTMGMASDQLSEFDARVIELGPRDAFARLAGMALGAPAGDPPAFDWAVGAGQVVGEGTVLSALVQPATAVFDSQGNEFLGPEAIIQGVKGRVDGIVDSNDSSLLRSSLVVLEAESEERQLAGTVSAIVQPDRFSLTTADGEVLVCAGEAQVLALALDGGAMVVSPSDFAALAGAQAVEVSGIDGTECFQASLVIIDLTGNGS